MKYIETTYYNTRNCQRRERNQAIGITCIFVLVCLLVAII